jgi:hypothetical protein
MQDTFQFQIQLSATICSDHVLLHNSTILHQICVQTDRCSAVFGRKHFLVALMVPSFLHWLSLFGHLLQSCVTTSNQRHS